MRAKLHKGDIHQELAQSVIFDSASSAHHFEDNSLTSFRFSIPSDHFLRQSEERFMIGLKSLTFTKTFRKNADINYEDLHVAFLLRNIPGVSGARYFPVKFGIFKAFLQAGVCFYNFLESFPEVVFPLTDMIAAHTKPNICIATRKWKNPKITRVDFF